MQPRLKKVFGLQSSMCLGRFSKNYKFLSSECSIVAIRVLPKHMTRVRFPPLAQRTNTVFMTDNTDYHKRVAETHYDHYPLNRMLPQYSVFNIFFKVYNSENDKAKFLNNHRYLKLREGYFSLFACKLFDEIEGREHYIIFTDETKGDVAFMAKTKHENMEQMELCQFDVKEYQDKDDKDFLSYLESISNKPKVGTNQYGLIIALNRDVEINQSEIKKLNDLSQRLTRGVFVCSAGREDGESSTIARCLYFAGGRLFYENIVEISNGGHYDVLVYQDIIIS